MLRAKPFGGFTVMPPATDFDRGHHNNGAAFSTLEEALEWLRVNMARPAEEPKQ